MRKALLAIALTCLSFTAYAQVGSSSGLRIQFKNQGTAIGTFTNWLPINCSTGMSCSFSGGIVTMTATGGGALTPPITISDTAANTDLSLINTTAALVGAAQSSPIFDLQGKYWSGASSADDWTIKSVLSNGLNGTSTLTIGHTGSTSQAVSIGASVSGTSFTAVAAGTHSWTGRSALFSPADGKVELLNNAGTAFTSLQFGGITSSFPEIKVNGTALNFRLADDSADAAITASGATLSGLSNGVVRSGSGALSGAELSGDATTSGSNAVTVVGTHLSTPLPNAQGGTGVDSSALTGVPSLSSGTWNTSGASKFQVTWCASGCTNSALTSSLGATTVCLAVDCPAGFYHVVMYMYSAGTGCTTVGSGGVIPKLTYTDDVGAKSAVSGVNGGPNASGQGMAFTTGGAAASYVTWDIYTGGAQPIQVSTTLTACTTPGSFNGHNMRVTLWRVG